MKIGFTGTSEGMTVQQKISLRQLLYDLNAAEFHHGDCIGADAEAHEIALDMKLRIVIHPPIKPDKRAWCKGYDELRIPKNYFARNRDIVEETWYLTGASVADRPLEIGGTWYTIKYAQKTKEPFVIWPNGTVTRLAILR